MNAATATRDHGTLAGLSMAEVFQVLTPQETREIDSVASTIECRAGKLLYFPNQTGEFIFILKQGKIQLYRMSPDGRKLVTSTIRPVTIFGEMALVGNGLHSEFAEAVEDSTLYRLNRRPIERLIMANPRLGIRLLNWMGTRLRESEEQLEQAIFTQVPNRLANLLVRMGAENKSGVLKTTHEGLAERLGVYRETVTMILNSFKREGLLLTGRGMIEIKDITGLESKSGINQRGARQ